jgi:pyrroline-5-carboxylate reductase
MTLGFIGIGKITGALIEGLNTSAMERAEILLSPRNEENSAYWAAKYPNVKRGVSNQDVLDRSDIIFIALRPAVAEEVLGGLSFDKRHTVISLIPLLNFAHLAKLTAPAGALCRAIPLPTVITHRCPIPLYNATDTVIRLLGHIGHPLPVADERQLHTLWTLTGLITPFYDLLDALSGWTTANGVAQETANRYIADLFESLSFMAQQSSPIDFKELAAHAATPNGMNEQAGREIREQGAHAAYLNASDHLLRRFAQ